MRRILFIFGTRPEAIKLCPVVNHLRTQPGLFDVRVCVTGQHRDMLDQVLQAFEIAPDYDLDLMLPGQTLFQLTARILSGLEEVIEAAKPDMVLVQGDTTTTLCGALAAFYKNVAVGHVEAGLRTGDMRQPFPEEMNRTVAGRLATLHFASTNQAVENLRREGINPGTIHITGNTGIDAVLHVRNGLEEGRLKGRDWPELDPGRRLVVVTAHRRESFGPAFESICRALAELSERPDVQIVYPVHPNPNVQDPVNRMLRNKPNILLVEPLDYVSFVDLMRRAWFIITDSGGIQEEGPSLGKPILVLREKTERPEAVAAGTVRLTGTCQETIVREATRLLEDQEAYERMARVHSPYGDGRASEQISDLIASHFGIRTRGVGEVK